MTAGSTAHAFRSPADQTRRPAVEVAEGSPLRIAAELDWHQVPPQHLRAWTRLAATMGPRTYAVWDQDTRVVRRIWGEGAPAAGSVASPAIAERIARELLVRHLDLLAPGATASDFVLVTNDLHAGVRTIGFVQSRGGLPVEGGQVSFRFKHDRLLMIGSEALPHVPAPAALAISDADASAAALAWVQRDLSADARVTAIEAARILPLVRRGRVDYATVVPIEVSSSSPIGRWRVYVDAASGRPVARAETLRFATGVVNYNAPVRDPKGARKDYPANLASLTVNGQGATSTAKGEVMWANNNPATVTARAAGKQFTVNNQAGGDATTMLNLNAGGSTVWSAANDELVDAQVATFVHANLVMDYVRPLDPQNAFLSGPFDANVNINDSCNAFYDGQAINFFRQSQQCANTGRIADIVYHEFGHGVHDHAILMGVGFFEPALSEGVSDFLSATITNDYKLGVGFFTNDPEPLRDLEVDARWPEDINGDPHVTGLIIAGALWDLRKGMIEDHGPAGVGLTDAIYYGAIQRATDIPTMYFEALVADDDDGNLDNGTPNKCRIDEAFALHGLYKQMAEVTGPSVAQPQLAGYDVSVAIAGGGGQCPGSGIKSADLIWRLREQPAVGGTIAMNVAPDALTGTIPQQAERTVVQYQVKVNYADNSSTSYPQNLADPFFEFFVGAVEEIYCTDFETDPAADGWTHGLTSGMQGEGADDWMWGEPMAPTASGDPPAAYDGTKVFGNDLGGGNYNGTYQPEKVNYAQSPAIDTTGYNEVRLQYRRWLNVEDGFYDRATIYANNQPVWQNLKTPNMADANVSHTDNVWRFHDVDLTDSVVNNSVTLKYEIKSDEGLELGGWTLDALCVVGVVNAPPPTCGDGIVSAGEACDDGAQNSDTQPDACRTDCSAASCGDGVVDSAESCDDGNQIDGDGCPADCGNDGGTGSTGGMTGTSGDSETTGATAGTGGSSGASATDGATSDDDSATSGGGADEEDGCGCRQEGSGSGGLALVGLGLLGLRRRRPRG